MRFVRYAVVFTLTVSLATVGLAQDNLDVSINLEVEYPDTLTLRLTGVFEEVGEDGPELRQTTIALVEGGRADTRWSLVEGERYEFELTLAPDGDWLLKSVALDLIGHMETKWGSATPSDRVELTGSFIARYHGFLLPAYYSEGDAERDSVVTIAIAPLSPHLSGYVRAVETDDPSLLLLRMDPRAIVRTFDLFSGQQMVVNIEAPDGVLVEFASVGNPERAVAVDRGETALGDLPPPPWAIRVQVPEGAAEDVLDGTLNIYFSGTSGASTRQNGDDAP